MEIYTHACMHLLMHASIHAYIYCGDKLEINYRLLEILMPRVFGEEEERD